MLRRVLIMAAAPNSRGRIPRANSQPLTKAGIGRHQESHATNRTGGRHRSSVEGKPPTGRPLTGHQTDRTLLSSVSKLNLHDSANSSSAASNGRVTRRPFSSNRRPVSIKSVDDLATLLREDLVKNVVVVVGAGISTPSGIPDFRSPGTGLYDNLQQYSIPYAEAIFDIDYFHHNPRPFFTLAKELYPSGKYRPNYLHYFAKLLHDRGLLLRLYTQNIDGLERIAGIPPDKLVEAHGTFATATCVTCRQKYEGVEIKEKIMEDKLPRCRRTTCNGIVKPDIVFFGEELPKRFYFYLKDMLQADLVLIMGTSLEVQPFAGIIDTVRFTIPRLLFNRMPVGPFRRQKRPKDFVSAGDLIEQLQQFVTDVGWSQDMEALITRREGYFRTAFPPPAAVSSSSTSDKKGKQPAKTAHLATMWRHNAQFNFYSDSDSSETDSGVTPSDTDSSSSDSEQKSSGGLGRGAGGGKGRVVGAKVAGKSSGSSTVSSSSSSGCVSNASTRSGGAVSRDTKTDQSPSLSNRRGGGGGGGGQGVPPKRSFSQQAVHIRDRGGGKPLLTVAGSDMRRMAWGGQEGPKQPPAPANQRKPPLAKGRGDQPARPMAAVPAPGTHAAKPRANSVTKAVPEKAHTKDSDRQKTLYPRVKSAHPARLAYQHRNQQRAYDAHLLDLSDSSSSDDQGVDEDSDDSSDDS